MGQQLRSSVDAGGCAGSRRFGPHGDKDSQERAGEHTVSGGGVATKPLGDSESGFQAPRPLSGGGARTGSNKMAFQAHVNSNDDRV